MVNRLWQGLALIWLAVTLVTCGGGLLTGQQAVNVAWEALAPNTSSGDRANWQVVEVRQVKGRDVARQFAGEPAPGCWQGSTPRPNGAIIAGADYWYVEWVPKPATPLPTATISPTAPPFIPEPFLRQALFLIDLEGKVVARKLSCPIY